jgi:nucleoside-diphosphate-sugar epimerase
MRDTGLLYSMPTNGHACLPTAYRKGVSRGKDHEGAADRGSGNLGQTLVPKLLDEGDTPVILDVRAPPPLNKGAVFIEGSVLDRSTLMEIFRGCDCIVHIAAWHGIHEDSGEKKAYDFFDLNVRGTFEVFEAAASAGIDKVIFISTTSVYPAGYAARQQQDSRRTDRGGLPKAPSYECRYTAPARVYAVLGSRGVRQIQRLGALVLERCGAYQ